MTTPVPVTAATDSFQGVSPTETVSRLGTDPASGLSVAEAARRLDEFGPNEIPEEEEPL